MYDIIINTWHSFYYFSKFSEAKETFHLLKLYKNH